MRQFCTYCGRSFTRSEHLERHILTHTKVKPHKCSICHISFTRRDLLRNHSKSHSNANETEAVPGSSDISTSRALAACESCVKRKVKCDNEYPCTRCTTRKLPCNPRDFQRSRSDANSSDTVVVEIPSSHDRGLGLGLDDQPAANLQQSLSPRFVEGQENSDTHMSLGLPSIENALQHSPLNFPDASINILNISSVSSASDGNRSEDVLYDSSSAPDATDEISAPGYLNIQDLHSYFLMNWAEYPDQLLPADAGTDVKSISGGEIGSLAQSNVLFPLLTDSNAMLLDGSSYDEYHEVITGREHWNVFKCNPPRPGDACPKTAQLFLQGLGIPSNESDIIPPWDDRSQDVSVSRVSATELSPILESTRDKLLAVSQGFLLKAHEIHSIGRDHQLAYMDPARADRSVGLLSLPSSNCLEILLRSFLRNFNTFYSTFPADKMDVNSLMMLNNNKTSALLVLLAIAQGAMTEQSHEGFRLSGGLTEVCRISLFDMIEKDIMLARDQLVLQSALIFTIQASWSGDKWLMDIGAGQRGIYVAMLRHGGGFDPLSAPVSILPNLASLKHAWDIWQLHESRARLIYSWVLADQEYSLFSDRAPLISVTELNTAVPNSDKLWHAKTALSWQRISMQDHKYDTTSLPDVVMPKQNLSLCQLFSDFLNDDLGPRDTQLTPLILRLLLYPIQGQVCHMRQLLTCFGSRSRSSRGYRSMSKSSVQVRLEEVQSLLHRWRELWEVAIAPEDQALPISQATLTVYHLIRLDTISSFSLIEKAAREYPQILKSSSNSIPLTLLQHPQEAVIQAGQVLRIVDSMPKEARPPWWPAAIYRTALFLWAYGLSLSLQPTSIMGGFTSQYQQAEQTDDDSQMFRIDIIRDGDEIARQFERFGRGRPSLVGEDGKAYPLSNPKHALQMCILFLNNGLPTRFSEGIKARLKLLSEAGCELDTPSITSQNASNGLEGEF